MELEEAGYRWFWYSRVLAQTAQAALLYGLLIYLVSETDSGIWPALFVITSIVPALVFGLIGGVLADWLPKRFFMFVLNFARALVILPLLRGDLSIADVFLLTGAIWTFHQFYTPAESALLPRLTSPEGLPRATSRYNLALPVAQLLGMVILAPSVLKFGNIDILLVLSALLYLAASLALLPVRPRPAEDATAFAEAVAAPTGFLRVGWREISSDSRAFAALVDSVMIGIGLSALVVIVPQFLEDVLNIGADNTVFVFAPSAVGLVIGLQFAPLLGRIIGHGRLATLGLGLFSLSIFALGSIDQVAGWLQERDVLVSWLDSQFGLSPLIATVMVLSFPAGFAVGLSNVAIRMVLIQQTSPRAHARVFSTQMTVANICALLPTIATGLLVDAVGVRPVAVVIALGVLAGAILGRRIGRDGRKSAGVPP